MTCKFKMLNIQIYSLVCNMLYFFKQIMISKTFSNFSQLFWISTQERLGVLSKQKKIYRYWPKRVEKYRHIGKMPISCIPSNMHPKKDFFFLPFSLPVVWSVYRAPPSAFRMLLSQSSYSPPMSSSRSSTLAPVADPPPVSWLHTIK